MGHYRMKTALIDGDVINYAVGFVADRDGLTEDQAQHRTLEFCVDIQDTIGADTSLLFLSDSTANNFRTAVATTRPYKGNRSGEKPTQFHQIREYMIDKLEAQVMQGMEADDGMGINQSSDTTICTIDKDLDQVPGWHFNWNKQHLYWVSPHEAMMFFLHQMLTGDRVDNIVGLHRVGPKTADKWLQGLGPVEAKALVRSKYHEYLGDEAEARLKENAQLLWIRRK